MKKVYNGFLSVLFILFINNSFAQLSGTYIIGGPNGDYPNPSIAIQDLVQQGISGPVVFEIYPGSYQVKETIPMISGSSLQNTITFISQTKNKNDVEFYYSDNIQYAASFIINLNGAKNIAFKSLTFTQMGVESGCISMGNYSGNISLIDNSFSAPSCNPRKSSAALIGRPNYPVFLSGFFVIQGNIFNKGRYGIRLASNSKIDKVTLRNNKISQCDIGVKMSNIDSLFVLDNEVSANIDYLSRSLTIVDVDFVKVCNNKIYGGSEIIQIKKLLTINNEFICSHECFINFGACGHVMLYNNSLLSHFNAPISTKIAIGFSNNDTLLLKNNIFLNDSSGYLLKIVSNSNLFLDNNIYYTSNDTIFNDGNANVYTSLTSWQQATGQDVNSVFVKPNFSKPNDLHLQANNPQIIGAAAPSVLVPMDIDGETRDAVHPDIGADEYSLRPILDSVVWGCAGGTLTLDAGAGFSSYNWSNSATTQTITVDTTNVGLGQVIYSVTVSYGGNYSSANTKVIWQDCTSLLHHQKVEIDVKVFPNPTNGVVNIDIPDDIRNFEIRVYNSNGSLLVSKINQKRINLSGNSAGLYFIQIITNESSVMRRLILN